MRVFPLLNKEAIEVIGAIGDAPDASCGRHLVNSMSSEALSGDSDKKKRNFHASGANVHCSLSKFSSTTKKPTEVFPNIQQKLITAAMARNQNKLFYKRPPVNHKDYPSSKKVIRQNTFPEVKAKPIAMNL